MNESGAPEPEDRELSQPLKRLPKGASERILTDIPAGVAVLDPKGRVQYANPAAARYLGAESTGPIGSHLAESQPGAEPIEIDVQDADGSRRAIELRTRPLELDGERLTLALLYDITSAVRQRQDLLALSYQDQLTGLRNRRGFFVLAQRRLREARLDGKGFGVVVADLDDLKEINDTFGHSAGDRALASFAKLMQKSFRSTDVLGRVGGDEFAACTTCVSERQLNAIVRRLENTLRRGKPTKTHPAQLRVSIGQTYCENGSQLGLEELVREADQAMYRAKQQRRAAHA